MVSWFRRYLLPGFVFQSIIIAGGYGTGRELVEFFLQYGPLGGLLGMLLPSTVLASITAMAAFEFARRFQTYDYRTFFERLLGRGWIAYEVCYLGAVLLILAVIGSAAGTFLTETFQLPYAVGVAAMFAVVGFLVFKGTGAIERFLAGWSFVLYGAYATLFLWSISMFGDEIRSVFGGGGIREGWVVSGLRYGALQVSLVPAMLFATRHIERRREALWAGALAGPIAIIPGIFFFMAMVGHYPEILDRPVPANYVLELLGSRPFQIGFQVVLFGTLIETGAGLIHAFNERVSATVALRDRSLPGWARPAIAIGLLASGALISRFGLVSLIATGYGALTWVFMAIVVVPLLTLGIVKIRAADAGRAV